MTPARYSGITKIEVICFSNYTCRENEVHMAVILPPENVIPTTTPEQERVIPFDLPRTELVTDFYRNPPPAVPAEGKAPKLLEIGSVLPSLQVKQSSLDVPCGSDATLVTKPAYTTSVPSQITITGMHFQDYYARYAREASVLQSNPAEVTVNMLLMHEVLLGLHKAGGRTLRAIEQDGANWKDSSALNPMDRNYMDVAERRLRELSGQRLSELENLGISFEAARSNPQAVMNRILDSFGSEQGSLGREIINTARMMPIYCEVVRQEKDLQCGDRLLDRKSGDGSIYALRGADEGDAAATAITYLVTTLTCQGPGLRIERAMQLAREKGPDAFENSSDENWIRNLYKNPDFIRSSGLMTLTDAQRARLAEERIAELEGEGMIARGAAMFTEARHNSTPNYYILQSHEIVAPQLSCLVVVSANQDRIVRGNPLLPMVVTAGLSIADSNGAPENSADKPMTVSLSRKEQDGTLTEVFRTTACTDGNGQAAVTIPAPVLNAQGEGNYRILAAFSGKIRGEALDCSAMAPLAILAEPPASKEPQPTQVYGVYYFPQREESSFHHETSIRRNIPQGAPIPADILDPSLEVFPDPNPDKCHDELHGLKSHDQKVAEEGQYVEVGATNVIGGFDIQAAVAIERTTTERRVDLSLERINWNDRRNPVETEVTLYHGIERRTDTTVGVQAGRSTDIDISEALKLRLGGRIGYAFGEADGLTTAISAAIGNQSMATRLAVEYGNYFRSYATEDVLAVSGQVEVLRNLSLGAKVYGADTEDPVLGVQIEGRIRF